MITNFVEFGDDFQNQLMIQIINNNGNANFGGRFISQSDGVNFSNDYNRRVFAIIKDFYNKYKKTPQWTTLEVEIKNSNKENAEMKAILCKHIKTLQGIKSVDSESVQDNAMKFVVCSNTNKIAEALSRAALNGDIETISKLQAKLGDITRAKNGAASVTDADDEVLSTEKMRKPFPTGLGVKLDAELGGGFAHGEIILIVAGTNVGKTTAACSMALNLSAKGLKVWYVYFEDTQQQITEKMFASTSGVKINDLKKNINQANNMWKAQSKIRVENNGKLYTIKMSSKGENAKIGNILKWMEDFAKDTGNPDVILFDYLEKPKSDRQFVKDEFTITGETFDKLESFCSQDSLNTCMVVFHQSNRTGLTTQEEQYLNWAHISGDIKSAKSAHCVITLYSNAELKKESAANALLLKSRMGNAYKKFPNIKMDNAAVKVEFGMTEEEQIRTLAANSISVDVEEPATKKKLKFAK